MAKKLGLALSAGAARGWAHVGVLRALAEMGLRPDVIAGCSVGALVGGAHLLGAMEQFEAWARTLSPLSALKQFTFSVASGGVINAESAFQAFDEFDQNIEDLDARYGAVACDLATGEEVELTSGSVLHAARASSAIPILLHAIDHHGRWLVDGAIVNPTPVSLARKLGADVVIAVDLNAVPRALARFDPNAVQPIDALQAQDKEIEKPLPSGISGAVLKLINDTTANINAEIEKTKARIQSRPHIFETAMAAADTVQMQISRARAVSCPADILLTPDMREAMPNAFDRADEFIETGRQSLLAERVKIETLITS